MRGRIISLLGVFLLNSLGVFAQKAPFSVLKEIKNLEFKADSQQKNVQVKFHLDIISHNLLIRINNDKGETIFLDNQYSYKGNYKSLIDFKQQEKGSYSVEIQTDNEVWSKKFDVK